MISHHAPVLRKLALAAFVLCSALAAVAQSAKRSFNIPASHAEASLREFARQAGVQIVFDVDKVGGVRTAALRGDFTPKEALDKLFAGTRLVAAQDEKTGALTVSGGADPKAPGAAPAGSVRPNPGPRSDSRSAATPSSPATEDLLKMSPFEVSTERDNGFIAASSLAGGRLAGDLKDTPAAYSVQTREFIDTLGLNDISAASQWSVNVATLQDEGATEIFGAPTQISFRGGAAAATQRDFFPFAVNYDSYNLERIDYARGPNAVLFGNGDYSGTVNAVSRVARTDRSFYELKSTYGSWNNQRYTLDANIVQGPRLALRVDTLYHDRGGWRDFDWEKKRGATLAATLNATATTQLRVQAEIGDVKRNNPFMTFTDQLSGWDGVTTFDERIPTTGLPAGNTARGFTQVANATTPNFFYLSSIGDVLDLSRTARSLGGNSSAAVPVGGQIVVGPSAAIANQPLNEALNLPPGRFDRAIAGSHFRYPARDFAVSTNNPSYVQTYHSFSGFLTQRIGSRLFASADANYSKERRVTEYINSRGLPDVYLDLNRNLPNGQPNPGFLYPYSEGYRLKFPIGNETKSIRAALAYLLKETRLGDFSFNAAWQRSTNNYIIDPSVFVIKRNADPRLWVTTAYNDAVYYRHYWNEPDFPTPEISNVTYNGVKYPTGWVKDISGTTAVPSISYNSLDTLQAAAKAKILKGRVHLLGAVRRDEHRSWNTYSRVPGDYPVDWDGSTYFWRAAAPADYTTLSYVPKNAAGVPTGPAQPAAVRPRTGLAAQPQYANDRFQDDYAPPDLRGKNTTYSVGGVGYVTRDLNVFYNYATTFNPSPARPNIYGAFYGPQVAAEWSAGVRENLADGRLSVSLGYYRGRQTGQVYSPGTTPATNINNIVLASPRVTAPPAPAAGQGNIRGVSPVPRFFDLRDLSNHGWEFELVANPTRNWRVTLNAALPRAYQENVASDFRAFLDKNDTALRQILTDTGVLIDPATQVAALDTSVPTNLRSPDAATVASSWNALQTLRSNLVVGQQEVTRLPLHSVNLFNDYTFRTGRLKGLKVGGGFNYRGRQAIGYRGADTIANPANPITAIDDPAAGPEDPVYCHGYTTVTAVLGYNFKPTPKFSVQLDLKIDNLLDYSDPLYTSTLQRPLDGNLAQPARVATPSKFYYLVPRNYSLSASVKF